VHGDVLDKKTLIAAMTGKGVVYANLAGDLEAMRKAMMKGARRVLKVAMRGGTTIAIPTTAMTSDGGCVDGDDRGGGD